MLNSNHDSILFKLHHNVTDGQTDRPISIIALSRANTL